MNDNKRTASYATFDTFLSVLNEFRAGGIPPVIDKETFEDKSRHDKFQLLGAFKFLDLIDEYGKPTQKLEYLVNQVEARPVAIKRLLELSYPVLFEHGISELKRDTLDKYLSDYNVNGETLKKARSFFINACRFAGIPLPPAITQRIRKPRTKKAETAVEPARDFFEQSDEQFEPDAKDENMPPDTEDNGRVEPQPSFVNTIILKSGGKLTLSAEVDVWKLDKEDRNLVFKLVDDMKDYEQTERP